MEPKDDSWREAIVDLVLQVYQYSSCFYKSSTFYLKSVKLRKRPLVDIPVAGLEHCVRSKKVARPDKTEAISKHQTRMLLNAND